MPIRMITDSSADLATAKEEWLVSVPLRIITDEKEYTDDAQLDVRTMVDELYAYRGRSSTSCPNAGDWLDAFGGASEVLCFTITSNLSGSYAAAEDAKQLYLQEHPEAHVYVVDSLSTGGEMRLLIEKARELEAEGLPFDALCTALEAYKKTTHLLFALESMKNLANNGRIDRVSALAAGLLGIRAVGQASTVGTLELLKKCRGKKQTQETLFELMLERGYRGEKLRIAHCENPEAADALAEAVKKRFPLADIQIYSCGALCSFYAERGGLILGFEGA